MNITYRLVLEHLDHKMEDSAFNVGKAVIAGTNDRHGGYKAVGTGVLVAMRKLGFVTRLPELRAWRITREGREALSRSTDEGAK